MAILRGVDGKFYDVPDDQVAAFEVPREKVKELLEKSGAPASQGAPGGGGPGGQRGAPPAGAPVIVQVFPGGGAPGGAPSGPPGGGQQGDSGDVHPYWWWSNYWPNWGNGWPNWGNY